MTWGAHAGRWLLWRRRACRAVVAGLLTAPTAVASEGLVINGGAPATKSSVVTLSLTPPPAAASIQVSLDEGFLAAATSPVAVQVDAVIPSTGPEERAVRFWVRYLDSASQPLPVAVLTEQIVLDTLAPRPTSVLVSQRRPVFVCEATGPGVGGTSRSAVEFTFRVSLAEAGSGASTFEIVGAGPVGPRDPALPANIVANPAVPVSILTRDAVGNVSSPIAVTMPAVATTALQPASLPFAFAQDCRQPAPAAWNDLIRQAWARSGRSARDRQVMRIAPSSLVWTYYRGHGLVLNWVHAATELKPRLKAGRFDDYRAGVAEAVALSTTERSPSGRTLRLNENWFTTPDDRHPPPWRDAMGTALILASLTPALASDAPRHERDVALQVATEYLESFGVDSRDGGLLWRERGPGEWFLEYTYRTDARVLNGFMQAVVSLDRFSRQADRLARRDARWRPLAARARQHVYRASRALAYWLPAYDLGGGRTRYDLTSDPASRSYRLYHQKLLGSLAQVSYVPRRWRVTFMTYRVRWGGSRVAVR